MNENRKKSLKAILSKKLFLTNCLWGISASCAIGYALEANDVNLGNYNIIQYKNKIPIRLLWSDIIGLTQEEIQNIIDLNDSKKIKELHEYCKNLLNSEISSELPTGSSD